MRLIDAESLSSMRFTHEMHDSEGRLYVPFDEVAEAIFKAPTVHPDRRGTTCKHRTAHGLCLLYTDAECTSWCVDGPCSDEEIAEPGFRLDEWCEDCKEYDKERHWCPRFNRVIHEVAKRLEEEKK